MPEEYVTLPTRPRIRPTVSERIEERRAAALSMQ